jgi:hypothetical protein
MGCGLIGVRRLATHGYVAKETEGMCLVSTPGVGAGELEETSSKRARLVYAADEE